MKRYTVIDHKEDVTSTYTNFQWRLAFALVFIFGILTGLVIG